jgi:hypothetical protein
MVMEKEMHCLNIGHLKSINRVTGIFDRPKERLDPLCSEVGSQPVPLIGVFDKETDIAIGTFVSRTSKNN